MYLRLAENVMHAHHEPSWAIQSVAKGDPTQLHSDAPLQGLVEAA